MNNLTFEKQFTHSIFCQQLQNIEIDDAKLLLADLHLLYLRQQCVFADLVSQDTFQDMN
jgi:hypothetical protein